MRTFIITKDGIARVMRTYAVDEAGKVILGGNDGPDAADEIAKWHPSKQNVTNIREIAEADIPKDVEYKLAWRDDGQAIKTDVIAARDIARDRIRLVREKMWPKYDALVTKALAEQNQPAINIAEGARQRLRDAPDDPRIGQCKDTTDLLAAEQTVIREIEDL